MLTIYGMGHIICVTSQKGGTGKTTTAVNLAAALALFEKKTLLIDCDPQGNATTSLGVDKRSLGGDLYHALVGKTRLREISVGTALEFLDVIPARFHLFEAETALISRPGGQKILRELLQYFAVNYKYVIIDSPPSLRFLTLCAIIASEWLIIPLQCQIYGLEGVGQLLNIVQLIQKDHHIRVKIAGFLLTMFRESDANGFLREGPLNTFKENLLKTRIPYDDLLRKAADFSKPLVLHDIAARGAQAYLSLAMELADHLAER